MLAGDRMGEGRRHPGLWSVLFFSAVCSSSLGLGFPTCKMGTLWPYPHLVVAFDESVRCLSHSVPSGGIDSFSLYWKWGLSLCPRDSATLSFSVCFQKISLHYFLAIFSPFSTLLFPLETVLRDIGVKFERWVGTNQHSKLTVPGRGNSMCGGLVAGNKKV